MYPWKEIILVLIWAILAFIIQPWAISMRITARYNDKEWVSKNLKVSQEAIIERFLTTIVPALGTVFNEKLSNNLKTFKASLFGPITKDGKKLEGEIEGVIQDAIEGQIPIMPGLPPEIMEKAMADFAKKHPYIALVAPYIPQMLKGGGDGGNPLSGRSGDLGRDF